MTLAQIISGGQTGADQAGLVAAKALGIRTGGYMPKGWITDKGPRPEFKEKYGMVEASTSDYRTRTLWNVRTSDGTVVFGDEHSPGSKLTVTHCTERKKPCMLVEFPGNHSVEHWAANLAAWVAANNIAVLNVAGNRERTNPGIFMFVKAVITRAWEG